MNKSFKEALESQKGAQFFKSYNNSLDWKHSIAEHFYFLGKKSLQKENEQLKKRLESAENLLQYHSTIMEKENRTMGWLYKNTNTWLTQNNQTKEEE